MPLHIQKQTLLQILLWHYRVAFCKTSIFVQNTSGQYRLFVLSLCLNLQIPHAALSHMDGLIYRKKMLVAKYLCDSFGVNCVPK